MKIHLALLLSASLAFGAGETNSLSTIARFGPVGMSIELIQQAFTMRIKNIEEGSPAAATGKLAIQGEVEPFCLWNNCAQDQRAPKL